MRTALEHGLAVCRICMAASAVANGSCRRCGARLRPRIRHSVQRTLSLSLAAAFLYVPANVLPIMITFELGRETQNTIVGGVLYLWDIGSYPVAIVILVASVFIPLGKLAALGFLCWGVTRGQAGSAAQRRQQTALYRIAELVGKWSMVDVFVVALLVALIQITGVMVVHPGAAALAFAGVVILTMLAVESFDPRLIWDRESHRAHHDPELPA